MSAVVLAGMVLMMAGCDWNGQKSDAYGQFQATEIQVAAQHRGQIRQFDVEEGERMVKGDTVGWVDTTELTAEKEEIQARLDAARSRLPSIRADSRVLQAELDMARTDLRRLTALKEDEATTQKQIDDVKGRIEMLKRKMEAVEVNQMAAKAEVQALQARLRSVDVRMANAQIVNPQTGTVLTTYKERGEIVQYGQPLFKIANLDTMKLRIYVSGRQLPGIKLGDAVTVLIDQRDTALDTLAGTVEWIASEAEFTPQMIQTREERVSQVYAVDIRVPNEEGTLKIGMPAEVLF